MTVEITSLTGAFGAEISGIDLSKPDPKTPATLRAALDEHLIRTSTMEPAE